MKPALKYSLIGAGTLLGLFVAFMAIFLIRSHAESKKMSPLATGVVADGIYAVKDDFVNMYIIKSGDGLIAIDAAIDMKNIKGEMSGAGLDPGRVKAVFLTHTDYDHVGALPLFKNAVVYLSKDEEQMINGKRRRVLFFHNKIAGPYKTLSDKQVVEIGTARVTCIITPGHTPGSACYLVNEKHLFTGDTLSLKDGHVSLFNELFNINSMEQRASWAKIMDLAGAGYIFTAHYGFSNNYRKAFEDVRGK
jgi:hydroxyacylglutathione hydrolase